MTTQEINRKCAELAGIKPIGQTLIPPMEFYPDFCADPRLVLEVMMKREDWAKLRATINHFCDIYDLILDTTGRLAEAAIEFMEKEGL